MTLDNKCDSGMKTWQYRGGFFSLNIFVKECKAHALEGGARNLKV
jgi:hypothetical protein